MNTRTRETNPSNLKRKSKPILRFLYLYLYRVKSFVIPFCIFDDCADWTVSGKVYIRVMALFEFLSFFIFLQKIFCPWSWKNGKVLLGEILKCWMVIKWGTRIRFGWSKGLEYVFYVYLIQWNKKNGFGTKKISRFLPFSGREKNPSDFFLGKNLYKN